MKRIKLVSKLARFVSNFARRVKQASYVTVNRSIDLLVLERWRSNVRRRLKRLVAGSWMGN
jgi:hypothetical protein